MRRGGIIAAVPLLLAVGACAPEPTPASTPEPVPTVIVVPAPVNPPPADQFPSCVVAQPGEVCEDVMGKIVVQPEAESIAPTGDDDYIERFLGTDEPCDEYLEQRADPNC